MRKNSKKHVSYANISLKKSSKIISVLVVFLLVSTVASSAMGSSRIGSKIASKLQETAENIKEKVNNVVETIGNKISQIKETISNRILKSSSVSPIVSFIKSIRSYFPLKNSGSLLNLYTKYADDDPIETPLKLLTATRVDVDGDGDDDIEARYSIYPFIEKPLALSFNIKLEIDRLAGFEDINEFFEAYVDFSFPGLLNADMADNKVQFGYQSAKGEEVPSKCYVTYQYVPYFFYPQKPLHKTKINPGSAANTDNLALIFNHIDGNTSAPSVDAFSIKLEPAVVAEITYGGLDSGKGRSLKFDSSKESTATIKYEKQQDGNDFNAGLIIYKISDFYCDMKITPFSKGGGSIEYERISSNPVDATLFFEKNASVYIYVDDIPKHVLLSWTPEMDGLVELNTFDERVTEIGIRNALHEGDVTAKAYVTNLPSLVRTRWDWNLLNGGEVDIYADSDGCSAHIYASDLLGTGAELQVDFSTYENINMSVFWDFSEKSFGIRRTNSDISVSASLIDLGGISLNLSFTMKNTITEPLVFYFGKLLDGDFEIDFTSNNLEIDNFDADVTIPGIGMFILKFNELKFNKQSGLRFSYSVFENSDITRFICDLEIYNGVELYGLVIGFNDFLLPVNDIIELGHSTRHYEIEIRNANVDFWMSEDRSQGYLKVYSGTGLTFTFDSTHEDQYGVLDGLVHGTITFETEDDYLNVSWVTVDGELQFSIDGSAVVALSGFTLWVKDKIDISIPSFVGRFTFNAEENTGEILLILEESSAGFIFDTQIDISGLYGISFAADIHADFEVGLSGTISLSWDETGEISIAGSAAAGFDGQLQISDLFFEYVDDASGTGVSVNADAIIISGDFSFSLGLSSLNIGLSSVRGASLTINGLSVVADTASTGHVELSWSTFYISGQGNLVITSNSVIVDVSGSVDITALDLYWPNSNLDLQLSFRVDLSFAGILTFDIGEDSSTFGVQVNGNQPIKIDNFYLNLNNNFIVVSWTKLHIKVNGNGGSVTFAGSSIQSINIDTTVQYVTLIDFEFYTNKFSVNEKKLELDAHLSVTAAGPLTIKAKVGGSGSDYIIVTLTSGSADLTNFYILVDDRAGTKIEAGWDELHMEGSFTLDVDIDDEIDIEASGDGLISLDDLLVSGNIITSEGPGDFVLEIDYFELDLDDINSSIIDLTIDMDNKKFGINSASASGSITNIEIQDLYASFYNVYIPLPVYINITEIITDISGPGYFSIELTEPDENGVQMVNVEGEVTDDNAYIYIDSLYFFSLFITVDIEEFLISGSAVFHLNAEGKLNLNQGGDNSALEFLHLDAGCTSTWSAKKLYIALMLGFDDFAGVGDISFGVDIDSQDPNTGYFIIDLDGSWSWSNLIILPTWNSAGDGLVPGVVPPLGPGDIAGEVTLKIDLLVFFALFEADVIAALPPTGDIIITAGSSMTLNQIVIGPILTILTIEIDPGTIELWYNLSEEISFGMDTTNYLSIYLLELYLADYVFSIGQAEIYPGSFSFLFSGDGEGHGSFILDNSGTMDLTFGQLDLRNVNTGKSITFRNRVYNFPYLRVDWDIDGDGSGYLLVDTNNEWCTITTTFFDILSIYGRFRAEDKEISWDFDAGPFNIFDISGSWELDFGLGDGISIFVNGQWYALFGDTTNQLNAYLNPSSPYVAGDLFRVSVLDSESQPIEGATVVYKKRIGLFNWQEVATLTTFSNGYTGYFTAETYNDDSTDSRVVISYSGYDSDTVNFIVNPSDTGIGYISGQVKDISQFGAPLPGATVSCSEDSDVSDSNGNYMLTVSEGSHYVTASYPGYESKSATINVVEGQTSPFTFNLMPEFMGSLTGRVKIEGTNIGIGGATVVASPGGNTATTWEYGADKGRFDMYLEPGTYTLTITHDEYESETVTGVQIYDNQETNVGTIYLTPINEPPEITGFSASPSNAKLGQEITFSFSADDPENGLLEYRLRWDSPTQPGNNDWSMDWADLNSVGSGSKNHAYDTSGTKKVWLQVRDDKMATDITSITVTITGDWVSPNSHENKLGWSNEGNGHDQNDGSCAHFYGGNSNGWCNTPLILKLNNGITCDGFKFKSKNGDHLEKIAFQLYSNGNKVEEKTYDSWEYHLYWNYKSISTESGVDEVRIWYKIEDGYGFGTHWANFYEFYFREQ